MTRRERQLLEWIRENPCISQQELADKAGITRSSAAVHISNLMRKGYIAGRGYLLREAPYIAVVGGVNMDIGAVSDAPLVARDSNPGRVTTSLGGVGRNIAHNLCLLGEQVSMITVLGQDSFAQSVLENAADIGLDLSHSATIPGGRTGTYLFIDGCDGDMALAVNDMAIYEHITPEFLRQRLDYINHADLVVVETNLPEASIQWLCSHCTAPVLADPVSTIKAPKLLPVLDKLTALKPNRMEAELLSGVTIRDETDVQKAAKVLLDKGVQQVYISLGSDGLYAEDQAGRHVRLPCPKVQVVNATGEVKAVDLVTVGAQVSGKIEKLYVSIGQTVKMGDMIAEIDSTTQQNDVDIAKAKMSSYQAQLKAAKTSLKIAKKQYQRMQSLKKQNAASTEDLENAEDGYESAMSKVAEIEASLKETEISLSTAETNLGYTKITAPLDGTIVSVPVKVGQTINAAMDTPTIVQIADLNQMEIYIEISEGDISNIKPGVKVTYSVLADMNKVYETTLKSIDPALTLLTDDQYTEVVDSSEAIYFYGRLVVPNADGKLRIGMTTQNVIYVESAEDVLTVPAMALKGDVDGKYVEVRTAEGVERRPVITGVSDDLNVEIKKGVSEGEEVVIAKMSSAEISDKAANARGARRFR